MLIIKTSGLLEHLPLALRKQDMELVEAFIEQKDRPDLGSRGYNFVSIDPPNSGGAQVPWPNKQAIERITAQLQTLLHNASYRDDRGMRYHNPVFLHIAERLVANRPLVPFYQKFFRAQLKWNGKAVPPYFFNKLSYMVSVVDSLKHGGYGTDIFQSDLVGVFTVAARVQEIQDHIRHVQNSRCLIHSYENR